MRCDYVGRPGCEKEAKEHSNEHARGGGHRQQPSRPQSRTNRLESAPNAKVRGLCRSFANRSKSIRVPLSHVSFLLEDGRVARRTRNVVSESHLRVTVYHAILYQGRAVRARKEGMMRQQCNSGHEIKNRVALHRPPEWQISNWRGESPPQTSPSCLSNGSIHPRWPHTLQSKIRVMLLPEGALGDRSEVAAQDSPIDSRTHGVSGGVVCPESGSTDQGSRSRPASRLPRLLHPPQPLRGSDTNWARLAFYRR